MIANLPKWYRITAIQSITEEVLEKRSKTIGAICTNKKLPWLLDCIRLYMDKPIKNAGFIAEFVKLFTDDDVMFTASDNNIELKTLAGAILYEYITENNKDSLIVALALKSAKFGVTDSKIINIEILKSAMEFILNESVANRQINDESKLGVSMLATYKADAPTLESVNTQLKDLTTFVKAFVAAYEKKDAAIKHRIDVLEEESNIHWWIFRAYSTSQNIPISELNPIVAPLIIARELFYLITIIPGPPNSGQFFNKLFTYIPALASTELSIKGSIELIAKNHSNILKNQETEVYGNLNPLLLGFTKAIDSGGDSGWTAVFEKATAISANLKITPLELAEQFFLEAILNHA